jgi:uncharacterized protein (DUF488 family)
VIEPTELFTIGYEGRTVEELIEALLARGVDRVIDVRELPLSRRKGFSKTALAEALDRAGIDYVHVREAGNPFRRDPGGRVLARYRDHLARTPEVVATVIDVARGRRAALLCLERDPSQCHRAILATAIANHDAAFAIANL